MLKSANVKIFSGPNLAHSLTFGPAPAAKLRHEYGDLACTVEVSLHSAEGQQPDLRPVFNFLKQEFEPPGLTLSLAAWSM
jgi:hypothetical protein